MIDVPILCEWQTALSFFLGSAGGGIYIIASFLHFSDPIGFGRVVRYSLRISVVCVALSFAWLLTSLLEPQNNLFLGQSSLNRLSWVTAGSLILLLTVSVFVITLLLLTEKVEFFFMKKGDMAYGVIFWIRRTLFVAGTVAAFGTIIYPGILFVSAQEVFLWHTTLLPIIFSLSALSSGVATAGIIATSNRRSIKLRNVTLRTFEFSILVLLTLEILFIADYAVLMLSGVGLSELSAQLVQQSLVLVINGPLALIFWMFFVAAGLALPFLSVCLGIRQKQKTLMLEDGGEKQEKAMRIWEQKPVKAGTTFFYFGAVGILIGSFSLYLLVLLTGLHVNTAAVFAAGIIKEITSLVF